MKLRELIANIDKSPENEEKIYSLNSELMNELQITNCDIVYPDERIKCYWLAMVGHTYPSRGDWVYFLDGEFVALGSRINRKDCEYYQFASEASRITLRDYVLGLLAESDDYIAPTIVDMDEDMGDGYQIYYVEDLTVQHVQYQGTLVTVTAKDYMKDTVTFMLNDVETTVNIRDVTVPYIQSK